jgi:hypothetical protein
VAAAARLLGVSRETLSRWISSGKVATMGGLPRGRRRARRPKAISIDWREFPIRELLDGPRPAVGSTRESRWLAARRQLLRLCDVRFDPRQVLELSNPVAAAWRERRLAAMSAEVVGPSGGRVEAPEGGEW